MLACGQIQPLVQAQANDRLMAVAAQIAAQSAQLPFEMTTLPPQGQLLPDARWLRLAGARPDGLAGTCRAANQGQIA